MKSAAIFFFLLVCLLQLATCLEDCGTEALAICENIHGDGRVCGCSSTTEATCTQRTSDYRGKCQGQEYLDYCTEFCAAGGHMCKGEKGGFCNQY